MNSLQKICLGFSLIVAVSGCASTQAVKSAADYFKDGESAYADKNYEEAITHWKKVKESYFSPELTTMAELKIADAQYENAAYIEAAAAYEEFRKLHPGHEKAPYALFQQALCNYKQITGIDTDQTPVNNSVNLFTSFIRTYPDSDLLKEAREKLEECVRTQLRNEVYVGRFYLRTEKYQSAIKRLEGALTRFAASPAHDETLLYLGQAFMLSGEKSKGRDVFSKLASDYPNSPYLNEARKFMEKNY